MRGLRAQLLPEQQSLPDLPHRSRVLGGKATWAGLGRWWETPPCKNEWRGCSQLRRKDATLVGMRKAARARGLVREERLLWVIGAMDGYWRSPTSMGPYGVDKSLVDFTVLYPIDHRYSINVGLTPGKTVGRHVASY